MPLNLDINPYFDDYNPTKNYHKILFVPGNPIQARELTQIQSILQEQIKRHGDHIFKNGTVVIPGHVFYDNKITYVKLEASYNGVSADTLLSQFSGQTITGGTSGVQANVVYTTASDSNDPATLFIRYTAGNGSNLEFVAGETLTVNGTSYTVAITNTSTSVGIGSICSISEGVYYVNGYFVGVNTQTIALDKYTNTPSFKIGLDVQETIVTAQDDPSLYDNALGFPNYAAPGADRYKISLVLTKVADTYTAGSSSTLSFIDIMQVKNGNVQYAYNDTEYSEINKMLARRTFDESGNYIVNPYNISIQEYRNNDRGTWLPGIAYLMGDVVTYTATDGLVHKYYARNDGISGNTPPTQIYGTQTDGSIVWMENPVPYINGGATVSSTSTINEHKVDQELYQVNISAGKSYINGFEVNNRTSTNIVKSKARTSIQVSNSQVYAPAGTYVTIQSLIGLPNIDNVETSTISDLLGNNIGTCWVRNLESNGDGTYKLFVFGINMNSGSSFQKTAYQLNTSSMTNAIIKTTASNITGSISCASSSTTVTGKASLFSTELSVGSMITIGGVTRRVATITDDYTLTVNAAFSASTSYTDVVAQSNLANLITLGDYIKPLSHSYIKSLRDVNGFNQTLYTITRRLTFTAASTSYTYNISSSLGDSFNPTGHILSDVSDGSIIAATYSLNGDATQLTINGVVNGHSYVLLASVNRSGAAAKEKIKTLSTKTIIVNQSTITDGLGTLITSSSGYSKVNISLTEADAVRVTKILMSGDVVGQPYKELDINGFTVAVDILDWFTLDTGNKAEFYDISTIRLKPGYTITKPFKVVFEYFEHSNGDYFSVDSYSTVQYKDIPTILVGSNVYDLRDCLDFRSRISDDGVNFINSGASVSSPLLSTEVMRMDYSYYLARHDLLSLTQNGQFNYSLGNDTSYPIVSGNEMDIARFDLLPYDGIASLDITYNLVQHRRYTMSDIGRLDQRLSNVEQYVVLNELEKKTSDLLVYDANGLSRFKNGFFVDQFKDLNVAGINSTEYRCSLDINSQVMRPEASVYSMTMVEPDGTTAAVRSSKHYTVTGQFATLPYRHDVMIGQTVASTPEFINPFAVVSFSGTATLVPALDTWFDIVRAADVNTIIEGNFNTLARQTGTTATNWRTIGNSTIFGGWAWGDWNSNLRTTISTQQRTVTTTSITQKLDALSRSTSSIKTIATQLRARSVVINLQMMKPYTSLYGFMDGINVNSRIKPVDQFIITGATGSFLGYADTSNVTDNIIARTSSVGSYDIFNKGEVIKNASGATAVVVAYEQNIINGANAVVLSVVNVKGTFATGNVLTGQSSASTATLSAIRTNNTFTTSSLGTFYGVLNLPGSTYGTGTHNLTFTDTITGNVILSTTESKATYDASGTIDTLTDYVVLQRNGVLSSTSSTQTQQVTTQWVQSSDPLSQSFVLPKEFNNGAFISKVDLYFATVNDTLPVTVQIVTMDNGYPSMNVVNNASVTIDAGELIGNTKGLSATTFTFPSLVYLQSNVEYAIKVLTNSTKYKVWCAKLGQKRIDNPALLVSEQPSTGVLFKSQNNSTWVADNLEDLTFTLYKATFDTSYEGTVDFTNVDIGTENLLNNPFKITNGSSLVRVSHPDHGLATGMKVQYNGSLATIFNNQFTVGTVTSPDSYIIDVTTSQTATDLVGGDQVTVYTNKAMDMINVAAQTFIPTGTELNCSIRTSSSSAKETAYTHIPLKQDYEFTSRRFIHSLLNETTLLANAKSLDVRLSMSSNDSNMSPMFDASNVTSIAIANRINNPVISDINWTIDGQVIVGTGGLSNTGIAFSSVDNSITSTTVDFGGFIPGAYLTVANSTSNNFGSGNPLKIISVDNVSATHKIIVDKTLTTETSSNTEVITQYTTFIDEDAARFGTALAKYVNTPVTLKNMSTGLKIMFAANIPNDAEIEVYYRTGVESSTNPINSTKWTKVTTSYRKNSNKNEFLDQEYTIENLTAFNTFQVKIVDKSINTAAVPKVRELRVIALA